MSWKASAWAKEQRLGSPAAKSILMCLADYADPEGMIKGWASQSELADAAEVSERSAREWLQRLEDWGLLERERQRRPSGARAADWIVLRLDRAVHDGAERCRAGKENPAPEQAGEEVLPANSAGGSYRQPDAEPTGNQTHPTGTQFRSYKEEPPIEPPLPSQSARQGARESGDLDDRKKIEKAYWRMVRVWPKLQGMPKDRGLKAFFGLSPEERDEAERKFPVWLQALKAQEKNHVPGPAKYFSEKLFSEIPEPDTSPAAPSVIEGKPWGPHWAGVCHRALLIDDPQPSPPPPSVFLQRLVAEDSDAGRAERQRRQATFGWPKVKQWHEAAANRRSIAVAAEDAWLADWMEWVPAGTAVFEVWRAEYERQGWPWIPDPGGMKGVFFPKGGPAGLIDFEAALRGQHEHDDRQEAAE